MDSNLLNNDINKNLLEEESKSVNNSKITYTNYTCIASANNNDRIAGDFRRVLRARGVPFWAKPKRF